jgi:predicted dienelactone hydrolase
MLRSCLLVLALGFVTVGAEAADPAKPGRFEVGVTTVHAVDTSRGRTIPTEIWYPAKSGGRDAELLPKAFPLALMAHGFCGSRLNYEYLTTHLASRGFIVGAPDFVGVTREACDAQQVTDGIADMARDLVFVCRTLHDDTGPLARYAQRVSGNTTGLVGHSLGGGAVVAAAPLEPMFTASVTLAPAATATEAEPLVGLMPRRAWLVMGGTADTLVSFTQWTEPFFAGLPTPSYLVRITDGTHGGFSDADSRLSPEALAAQQAVVKRYTTAFFFKHLVKKKKFGGRLRDADDGSVLVEARPR